LPLLEIIDLSVRYQDSSQWALEEVNISVEKEELIIVAGSSGCGKSTLAQSMEISRKAFKKGNHSIPWLCPSISS